MKPKGSKFRLLLPISYLLKIALYIVFILQMVTKWGLVRLLPFEESSCDGLKLFLQHLTRRNNYGKAELFV